MTRDTVFSDPSQQIVDFVFDETVAGVFPDMIRRSVPGYELVVPMTGLLAARQLRDAARLERGPGTRPLRVYDLGCSLGATSLAILHALVALEIECPALEIIAVDNAPAMLDQARINLTDPRVTCATADIRELNLKPCEVVTLNWVMQFLPPDDRHNLLERICASLAPGGLLLLSEKVRSTDPQTEAFNDAAHLDFKRANGYSELEISGKRSALEQVMIPDTIEAHLARLRTAGFRTTRVWHQCLNWASFAASP